MLAATKIKKWDLGVRTLKWRGGPWSRLRREAVRGQAGRRVLHLKLFREEVKTLEDGDVSFAIHLVALFITFDLHLIASPS